MIRIPINLATEPFRRDRPILVASIAAGAILGVLLLVQIGSIVSSRGQADETRIILDRVEAQASRIAAEQAALDVKLRRPENAEVLERSLFLNEIIEHKAISWTRVFADLERVFPNNVRLVQVRLPQVDGQNRVLLEMTVGAEGAEPVLQLLKQLEKSPQFGPSSVLSSTPPSQTDRTWKYRVSVNYAQKL